MRPFALLCLLCVWVTACDRPATQIVVRVDSDMREGEELRAVRVTLRRVGADRDTYDETFDLTQGTLRLPGTVGVVPGDPDDTRRLEVEARALVQNGDDFSTRALVSFQPEQTLLLDLYLAARCRDPNNRAGCGPDETCGPDGCTAITRARLPGFEPDAARLDAPPREEDAALDEDIPAPTEEDIPAPKDEDIPVAVEEDIPVTVEEDIPAPLDVVVPCGGRGEMCCAGGVCRGGDRCVGGVCVACGGSGQACCVNDACGAGSACVGGTCAPCGGSGQPCCAGGACAGRTVCTSARCTACGASGQPCCAGSSCDAGRVCSGGRCALCGANGQPCCAGGACVATGNPCVAAACASGVCRHTVRGDGTSAGGTAAMRCCGGAAVDISTNPNHCGGCGMRCGSGACEPLSAIPCGGGAGISGRCRCTGNAQCPTGRSSAQICRTPTPYAGRCAPENVSDCAPGASFFDISSCPNYCRY